jgi:type I restriction enzyme S subunit
MLDAEKNSGVVKPYLGNRSVQWGRFDLSEIGMIKLTVSDLRRFRIHEGDLLVCEGGEIGRAAIWKSELDECYFQKALHRLQPKKHYSTEYMLFMLDFMSANGFLTNFVTQTSIAHLPKDKFETIPLPLPTFAEQEAIASALSDADAWIESLEQLIAKKRQIKQGAMQELLTGKRRLPGFEVIRGFKLTDVGEIPLNWTFASLGSICKIERGKFTARPRNDPKYYGGDIPFIQTGDVSNSNGVIKKHSQTLNELGLRVSKRFPAGTLFITIAANIGDIAVTEFDTACPDSLVAILPSNAVHQSWLYHELKRNKLKFQVIASSNAQSNLNLEKITPFLIPLPPTLAEQQAIATVLSDMDTEIESLESKLAKAREIKQGMMQELLTGRIRLV